MRILLAFLVLFAGAGRVERDPAPANRNYVLHEWGTFTTVAGADGKPVEWEPLSGNTELPAFVHLAAGLRDGTLATRGTVRMETPVLYFHSQEAFRATVRVGFPGGAITEWYPAAHEQQGGIVWRNLLVAPGSKAELPPARGHAEYFAARVKSAAPVQAGNETEGFLFYRGTGSPDVPITVTLEGKTLHVGGTSRRVIAFERRGRDAGFRAGTGSVERPALSRKGHEGVEAALREELLQRGLYADEAEAMLATWRESWFEEGLRVFWFVEREAIDAMLPLTVTPAPRELQRVIVGRAEVFTPEMEALVAKTGDASRYGRFAEPLLRRVCTTRMELAMCIP